MESLPNGKSSSYGMNVGDQIMITQTQLNIMKILNTDPELNNREIGERLGTTRGGVQSAIVALYARTGAKTRQELVALYSLMVVKDQRMGNAFSRRLYKTWRAK